MTLLSFRLAIALLGAQDSTTSVAVCRGDEDCVAELEAWRADAQGWAQSSAHCPDPDAPYHRGLDMPDPSQYLPRK